MSSVLARAGVAFARLGVVVLSLGVGGFLIWRAQEGANGVSANTAAPAPVPVAQDAGTVSPESVPQALPLLAPLDFTPPTDWLPSSKSFVLTEQPPYVFDSLAGALRAPDSAPGLAGESADSAPSGTPLPAPVAKEKEPHGAPPAPRMQTPPRYLYSSKSTTTFAPPPAQSGDGGWKIAW